MILDLGGLGFGLWGFWVVGLKVFVFLGGLGSTAQGVVKKADGCDTADSF